MKDNEKYYKQVKRMFPLKGKIEKIYLSNIKKQIKEYESNSYDEIVEMFGEPKEVVKAYYDTVDSNYLIHKFSEKRNVEFLIIIIILLSIVFCIYRIYAINEDFKQWKESIPVEVTEEIVEIVD